MESIFTTCLYAKRTKLAEIFATFGNTVDCMLPLLLLVIAYP